jgi:hypothetical protein
VVRIANSLLRTCSHALTIPRTSTTSPAVEDLLKYIIGNEGSALLARVAAWTVHELDDLCKLSFMPLWKESLRGELNILEKIIQEHDFLFSRDPQSLAAIGSIVKGLSDMDVWTVGLWLCRAKAQRSECFIRLLELPHIPAVVHYYIRGSLLEQIERIPTLEDFCAKFHKSLFWDGKPETLKAVDISVKEWVWPSNFELAERLSARRFKLQKSLLQDLLFGGFRLSKEIQCRISQEQGFDAQLSKLELMLEQEQQTFVNAYLTAEKLLKIAKDITGPEASQLKASLHIIELIHKHEPIVGFHFSSCHESRTR